ADRQHVQLRRRDRSPERRQPQGLRHRPHRPREPGARAQRAQVPRRRVRRTQARTRRGRPTVSLAVGLPPRSVLEASAEHLGPVSISRRKLLRGLGAGVVWTVGTRAWGADSPALPTSPPPGLKLAAPVPHAGMKPIAPLQHALHPQTLPRFVDPLPVLPVAKSAGTRAAPDGAKGPEPLYRMVMQPVE